MASLSNGLLARFDAAAKIGPSAVVQSYESEEAGTLALGDQAIADPVLSKVQLWLRVFSRISSLSVEGPIQKVDQLRANAPDVFAQALNSLDPAEQAAVRASIDAPRTTEEEPPANIAISKLQIPPLNEEFHAESAEVSMPLAAHASFVGPSPKAGSPVAPVLGTLSAVGPDGAVKGTWTARTGGFVAGYWHRNGPTPPGTYVVSNYRPNRFGTPGMELNHVSFSFDLDPAAGTNVFGRSALRIHPDGPPLGTHGCIGVSGDAAQLKSCAAVLKKLIDDGKFLLNVTYSSAAQS